MDWQAEYEAQKVARVIMAYTGHTLPPPHARANEMRLPDIHEAVAALCVVCLTVLVGAAVVFAATQPDHNAQPCPAGDPLGIPPELMGEVL